jgi:hypothetical protein
VLDESARGQRRKVSQEPQQRQLDDVLGLRLAKSEGRYAEEYQDVDDSVAQAQSARLESTYLLVQDCRQVEHLC